MVAGSILLRAEPPLFWYIAIDLWEGGHVREAYCSHCFWSGRRRFRGLCDLLASHSIKEFALSFFSGGQDRKPNFDGLVQRYNLSNN
jgi:hypothetical protein